MIQTQQLFGTELDGPVENINSEAEHMRIGLCWDILGAHLDIISGPSPGANMANSRGVLEEVARHLVSCGVNVKWFYSDDRFECFEVRPNKVKQVKCLF